MQAGPRRHLQWPSGLSPPCSTWEPPASQVLCRGTLQRSCLGGICGMKPACAFGDSSRFHLADKKGRYEGNDIYVLGKPSCSKLPPRREPGRGRRLPLLRAGEQLLGCQPGIPVPRATPTSICRKMQIPASMLTEMGERNQCLEGKGR